MTSGQENKTYNLLCILYKSCVFFIFISMLVKSQRFGLCTVIMLWTDVCHLFSVYTKLVKKNKKKEL